MAENDVVRKCENCRFAHINWRKGDDYVQRYTDRSEKVQSRAATSVQCRRHAPTKTHLENDSDGWPWISGDDWCGEYTPNPKGPHNG